jgi:hypothetical protein
MPRPADADPPIPVAGVARAGATRPDARGGTTFLVMAEDSPPSEPEETPAPAPEADLRQAASDAALEAPPSEAVVADADAPVGSPEAVELPEAEPAEPPKAQPEPAEPEAVEPPATEAEAPAEPAATEPAAEAPAQPEAEPATEAQSAEPAATEPAAEAPAAEPAAEAPAEPAATEPPAQARKPRQGKPRRERQRRPPGDRGPRQPQGRFTGPLPFQELRDAASAIVDLFGARQALRDAFSALGEKERRDLSRLVAEDGDWRVRARNIAAGSLGAGRVGKALAAQQISMARIEDLWTFTLSKEEADQRLSRVRDARRRDERRAQRDADRESRSDRVSRADLQKAQDGRVGAQIRFVVAGEDRDRKRGKDRDREAPKDEPKPDEGSDLLDRLGY